MESGDWRRRLVLFLLYVGVLCFVAFFSLTVSFSFFFVGSLFFLSLSDWSDGLSVS